MYLSLSPTTPSVRKRRDYLPRGDETFCHDGGAFELIYVQFIAYIQCVIVIFQVI